MTEVVGIKYDMTGRLVYVLPDRSYRQDDLVIVETSKGKHLAQVVRSNRDMEEQRLPAVETMAKVLGPAQQKDVARYQDNLQLAEEHFGEVERLIAYHGLDMKLVDIVFPLERQRVLITFVAEKRVDFRQLLKDLASLFRARIELRQINNREEAKIYGGLGPCGRALCCSSFLGEFPPVSIKMAKNQNLSLNAGKTNAYVVQKTTIIDRAKPIFSHSLSLTRSLSRLANASSRALMITSIFFLIFSFSFIFHPFLLYKKDLFYPSDTV